MITLTVRNHSHFITLNFPCSENEMEKNIASVDNGTIKLRRFNRANSGYTIEVSLDTRLNHLLFAPDIKKWEEIKNMKYGQYIHRLLKIRIGD